EEIGGNRSVKLRIIGVELRNRLSHAVQECLTRRPQVGPARSHRVVTGGGGARMKITRTLKLLADEPRTCDLPVQVQQAAVGLRREEKLAQSGHQQRVCYPSSESKQQHHAKCQP